MADGKDETPHEIVLIRRRNDHDHDEPHGGVWKVAFADFMTAMMAFFLVLWIVNSTTKQTRSSLARYFNPVRLSDTTPARKGLKDPKEGDFDAAAGPAGMLENDMTKAVATPPDKADLQVGNQEFEHSASSDASRSDGGRGAHSLVSPQLAKDPFARPRYPVSDEAAPSTESKTITNLASSVGASSQRPEQALQEANSLRADLAKVLGGEEIARLGGALDVSVDVDGLLISLTDRLEFGMFSIGSAVPEPRLVRALGAISAVVRDRSGDIIIRGHTDARPYRNRGLDNWRLSAARAETAFSLLVKSGLDERRVARIEGYADRRLKASASPEAPENRRIEILIRKGRA